MARRVAVLLLGLLGPAAASSQDAFNPIQTVISLLTDMKSTVEKDAKDDLEAYDKYMCWCETHEKEKTSAIASAEQAIQDLSAFLQEAAGREGQLKTEIAQLAESIAADQDALASAAAVRSKQEAAFRAEESDSKETRALLAEALDTLQKVQLVQKNGRAKPADRQAAARALIQVRNVVSQRYPKFHSVMQRDLFDVLGSLEQVQQQQLQQRKSQAALFSEAFLPKRGAAALEQTGLLPWEKTEEQVGAEAKPNEQQGAAAGAKSYYSRSGAIVGILAEMLDEFTRDLSSAQRADLDAEVQFQHLRAAKTNEIAAAQEQKKRKEAALVDLLAQVAQAKKDLEATTEALGADQTFLANLKANCKSEDERYQGRVKDRSEELRALAEALKVLTEDDARELFGKTMSFLQVASGQGEASAESLARQDSAAEQAMQRIAAVARRHKDWSLASLAVRVRLDAFEKVKEVMDKMSAELARQQKEEYDKNEFCKKEIDETEDSIKVSERTKKDLAERHQALSNTLDTLAREIEELKTEVHDMEVALKQAGEQRKAGNQLFQSTLADQRATVNIIKKAQKRLQDFYTLVEVREHGKAVRQTPGAAVPPPPPTPEDYHKSAGSGGVLQLLAMIVNGAERAEVDLQAGEQQAQKVYAEFVRDTADSIQKDRALVQEKEALVASTSADKSETQASQLANDQDLEKLNGILKAQHIDCDFLLQYFTTRQKARQEEIDSINDAKAILSGAAFGK